MYGLAMTMMSAPKVSSLAAMFPSATSFAEYCMRPSPFLSSHFIWPDFSKRPNQSGASA